jgi:hypothetical protein
MDNSRACFFFGGSGQQKEIPHGGLGHSVQTSQIWGLGDPQYQIHEHRSYAKTDLEVISERGGYLG